MSPLRVHTVFCFGEVVIDEFPDRRCLGGAPFNVAYSLHRLGTPAYLVSAVGRDEDGEAILNVLRRAGMPTDYVARVDAPTGKVAVELDARGAPTFTIAQDVAWDRIEAAAPTQPGALVYYGSLAQRSHRSRHSLQQMLEALAPRSPTFCDLNLRPPHTSRAIVLRAIESASMLKLNRHELRDVATILELSRDEMRAARALRTRFDLDVLLVTRGEDGVAAFSEDQEFLCSAQPCSRVVDTVGAGDAFSAMFLNQLGRGAVLTQAVEEAVVAASKSCERAGATPVAEL